MKAEELSEEDFILKWGFIRQTPLLEQFKRDLDYQFKSRVNAISDEDAIKGSEEIYGEFQKYFRAKGKYYDGFATGYKWFKEQLLK